MAVLRSAGSRRVLRVVAVAALMGSVLAVAGTAGAEEPVAAPLAPTIDVATAGNGEATVSWSPPTFDGGSPVLGYVVTPYVRFMSQGPRYFLSTATTQVIKKLTNGTTYRFKVRAFNAAGVSGFSGTTNPVVPILRYGAVFDGQSLCILGAFPHKVMTAAEAATGLTLWRKNVAVGGWAWHQLAVTAPTRLHPYGNVAQTTALVMNGGQSDVWAGESGAQIYAEEVAYANAARAAGFDVVVIITISPGNYDPDEEAARIEHNQLLLADASGGFDAVVDVATLPELSDPTNPIYYDSLHIHWTVAGAQVAADAVAPVLQAALGL